MLHDGAGDDVFVVVGVRARCAGHEGVEDGSLGVGRGGGC